MTKLIKKSATAAAKPAKGKSTREVIAAGGQAYVSIAHAMNAPATRAVIERAFPAWRLRYFADTFPDREAWQTEKKRYFAAMDAVIIITSGPDFRLSPGQMAELHPFRNSTPRKWLIVFDAAAGRWDCFRGWDNRPGEKDGFLRQQEKPKGGGNRRPATERRSIAKAA